MAVGEDALVEKQVDHARIVRLAPTRFNGESPGMRRLLIAVLVACGGQQVAEQHPTVDITKDLPATLEATHPKEGEPRTVHVRIWADTAVRAIPHWKEDVADQIDYASQFLTPLLGTKLAIESYRDWDRSGDPHEALAQLEKADDGKDVTWVIGYVAPPDIVTKAMGELGDAHLLGHTVIVRWYNEPPDKNAELRDAKKRHKQTVILLHMLAQTLGAIAENDPGWIQNPAYSKKQSTFSDRNRELLQMAIDQRLTGGTDDTLAHDLLEAIEKQDWGGWIAADHDEVVATLRAKLASEKAGKTASQIPAAAIEQYDRIKGLALQKKFAEALLELDNVLTAYPANANLHQLKCEILIAKQGIADKATKAACARVTELAPGDPSPHMAVALALVAAHDVAGARAELQLAAGKIANLNTGQADAWRRLVAVYMEIGALTWAEEALATAKLDTDPALAQIASTRARYGIAKGSKTIKPEAEGPLVAAIRQASQLIYGNKYADAHKALDAIDKKWPGAPGALAFHCDLAMREGAIESAKGYCARALAADPNESWALYLSGVLALRDTSGSGTRTGIDKLKRAIAADPDLGQAWRALAKAYARAKDQAALEKLAADYATKFGTPLPQ
jgi:predicted Zn-dependent protease